MIGTSEYDHLQRAAKAADVLRRSIAERARVDPVVFQRFVLRDEETNGPVQLAPMHVEWQDLCSKHKRMVLWAAVEHGKSSAISICRNLWEIGRNPRGRFLVLSATEGMAKKIVATVARYILKSEEYQLVFPHVRPSRSHGEGWTETSITVERAGMVKDPTLQARGYLGKIMGSRFDGVVVDDLLNFENTLTRDQRDKVFKWLQATLIGRLTREAFLWFVGTAYHKDDVMHRFARFSAFSTYRYPAINERGEIAWAARYTESKLAEKRAGMTPTEFARQFLCMAWSDEESRFKEAWIQKAVVMGRGSRPVYAVDPGKMPRGSKIYTGVDLAVQQGEENDLTAFFTLGVTPAGKRRPLWIKGGKMSGPDIIDALYDHHHRYGAILVVENVAAQDYILQFARVDPRGPLPVIPYTTGRGKAHPEFGIESIAAEMANGGWEIPSGEGSEMSELGYDWVEWIQDMLTYNPSGHTGDRLMAAFLAREGARIGMKKGESGKLDTTTR